MLRNTLAKWINVIALVVLMGPLVGCCLMIAGHTKSGGIVLGVSMIMYMVLDVTDHGGNES